MEPLKFQGTLEKQGKMKTWSWKKYWFVLKNDQLTYVKDQSTLRCQGNIDLSQAQSITIPRNCNHGYPIEIVTKSRNHYLSASSMETRDKWIKMLREGMAWQGRGKSLTSSTSSRASCDSITSVGDDEVIVCPDYSQVFMATKSSSDSGISANGGQSHMSTGSTIYCNPIYHSVKLRNERHQSDNNNTESQALENSDRPPEGLETYEDIQEQANNKVQHVSLRRLCKKPVTEEEARRHSGVDTDSSYGYATVQTNEPGIGSQARIRSNRSTGSGTENDYEEVVTRPGSSAHVVVVRRGMSGRSSAASAQGKSSAANKATVPARKTVPDLPHPRLELTWGSTFDQIRTFIARNRGPNELYAKPKKDEQFNGTAIQKLKEYLLYLDGISHRGTEH